MARAQRMSAVLRIVTRCMDSALHVRLYLFFVGLMWTFMGFWQFEAYDHDPNYNTMQQTTSTLTSMLVTGGDTHPWPVACGLWPVACGLWPVG